MKSERTSKVLAIAAIVLAMGGLSVGFAALSETLTINGSAQVTASSWDIEFENLQAVELTGTAAETVAPTLTATNISGFTANFLTPGDSVTYQFDVANNGTFDAILTNLDIALPTCSTAGGGTAATSAVNVCANIDTSLTYLAGGTVSATDDATRSLAAGDTVTMRLTVTYNDFADSALLATENVTITDLGATLLYEQN